MPLSRRHIQRCRPKKLLRAKGGAHRPASRRTRACVFRSPSIRARSRQAVSVRSGECIEQREGWDESWPFFDTRSEERTEDCTRGSRTRRDAATPFGLVPVRRSIFDVSLAALTPTLARTVFQTCGRGSCARRYSLPQSSTRGRRLWGWPHCLPSVVSERAV